MTTSNSITKIDQLEKILPAPGNNQIAEFIEFRPLMNWKKSKIPFSRAQKIVLYKFSTKIKFCLFITSLGSYVPRPRDPTFSRPKSPRPTSPRPKCHVPIPLLVTALKSDTINSNKLPVSLAKL